MSNPLRFYLTLLLCLAAVSCYAPVSVSQVRAARPVPVVLNESDIKGASGRGGESPLVKAAGILDSLRVAHDRLAAGDARALPEYNYLIGRLLEQLRAAGVKPWQNEVELPGGKTRYVVRGEQPDDLRVSNRSLIAVDTLKFRGKYAKTTASKAGAGAPLLAVLNTQASTAEAFDEHFRYRNVTAMVHFKGKRAIVDLDDPYEVDSVAIGGHRYPLQADFGANISYGLTKARVDKLGLIRLLFPQRYSDTCHLSLIQPYDRARIPVLLVHGLQDTPASFLPMYLDLMEDPEIRGKYQFWVFSYPSGYPYPYSGALLRQELDQVKQKCPGHKGIVMIGHSMGGLLTRLMVTDVGDKLWVGLFEKPPSKTDLAGESRQILEESLIFNSRDDVDRAIFIAAPHKGSSLASHWIGRFGSKLVRSPAFIADARDSVVNTAKSDPAALVLNRAPNSIDTLAPNNRFILGINQYSVDRRIPFHSIIGDRGKGNSPDSSDGVVAYWSSHLDGAASEKIVASGHSAHQNADGIEEVRRILLMHAGQR